MTRVVIRKRRKAADMSPVTQRRACGRPVNSGLLFSRPARVGKGHAEIAIIADPRLLFRIELDQLDRRRAKLLGVRPSCAIVIMSAQSRAGRPPPVTPSIGVSSSLPVQTPPRSSAL